MRSVMQWELPYIKWELPYIKCIAKCSDMLFRDRELLYELIRWTALILLIMIGFVTIGFLLLARG